MKRLLLVFCCVILVACNSNSGGSGSNNESKEPEVLVESLPLLEDTNKIQEYLQTVEGFVYTEAYSQEEIDILQDGSNELMIITETGQTLILSVENEVYVSILTEIVMDEYSSYEIIDDYILIHHDKDNLQTMDVHYVTDEGIFKITEKAILISGTKVIDPYINTTEVITSNIESEDSWRKFTVHTTSIYTDEKNQTHDVMDISTLYFLDKINKKYNLTVEDLSQASSALTYQNGLKSYGDNSDLKTFEQIFAEEDLSSAIIYYDLHRDEFIEGAKEAFANGIISQLRDIVNRFDMRNGNFFEHITVSDEGIFFTRNDGQLIPKLQSVMAYYETLPLEDGVVGEMYYQFGFKKELAMPIYHALLDTDLIVDKGTIKTWLVMLTGYDAFIQSSIPLPNVVISKDEDLKSYEGERKAKLVREITLLNEPIILTNLKDLKQGKSIGNCKIKYLQKDPEEFNINLMGEESFVGELSYSSSKDAYFIDIDQMPTSYFYYEFSDKTVYFNYLSGKVEVLTYKEEPETIFPEALLNKVKSGETVKVNGYIQLWFINKKEEWVDAEPLVPAIEIKEIWESEE